MPHPLHNIVRRLSSTQSSPSRNKILLVYDSDVLPGVHRLLSRLLALDMPMQKSLPDSKRMRLTGHIRGLPVEVLCTSPFSRDPKNNQVNLRSADLLDVKVVLLVASLASTASVSRMVLADSSLAAHRMRFWVLLQNFELKVRQREVSASRTTKFPEPAVDRDGKKSASWGIINSQWLLQPDDFRPPIYPIKLSSKPNFWIWTLRNSMINVLHNFPW